MSQTQGRFIQMLATLSQIQQGRQELSLRERQLASTEAQQAEQLKELKKQGHSKDVLDAIKTLSESAPEARNALLTIYNNKKDFAPEELAGFTAFAQGQPISQAMQAAMSSQAGFAAMTPGQQGAVNQESAGLARTGMNQGQLAQSGVGAAALGGGSTEALTKLYGEQMTRQLMEGFAARTLTGQTPFEGAVGQSAMAQGFAPNVAKMQYQGVQTPYGPMLPAQAGQLDIGRGGVEAAMGRNNIDLLAAQAAAGGKGAANIGQVGENLARMASLIEKMQAKGATVAGNTADLGIYNTLAQISGLPHLIINNPRELVEKRGLLMKLLQAVTGSSMPAGPPSGESTNPMSYFYPRPGAPAQLPPGQPAASLTMPQGFNPFSGGARP